MCTVRWSERSRGAAASPQTDNFPALQFKDWTSSGERDGCSQSIQALNVNPSTQLGSTALSARFAEPELDTTPTESFPPRPPGCENAWCLYKQFPHKKDGWKPRAGEHWESEIGPKSKLWGFASEATCFGQSIFQSIFNGAFYSGVVDCHNPECQKRKQAFADVAPGCAWTPFRDFLMTVLACVIPRHHWFFIITDVFQDRGFDVPASFCIDVRGIIDVFNWTARLTQETLDESYTLVEDIRKSEIYAEKIWRRVLSGYESDALIVSQRCHDKGLCPNRLWNAAFEGYDTSLGVFHLGESIAQSLPLSPVDQHVNCTAQHCLLAYANSTLVKQAHKCIDGKCGRDMIFPSDLLNRAYKERLDIRGAWCLQTPRGGILDSITGLFNARPRVLQGYRKKYMAISHVWSDGTGVGLKSPGRVNGCLYQFFEGIARELGCEGLWWDAISIPTERSARAMAIERMLDNYEKASITLVHDQELVNFPWKDDGTPAIALVLSSWFTRGWTAAELFVSRTHPVKVLFADPAHPHGKPLIKDLDTDIFAAHVGEWMNPRDLKYLQGARLRSTLNFAGKIPTQGYFYASRLMSIYRHPYLKEGTQIEDLGKLFSVLSRRATSWVKDQMLIAGLMCNDRIMANQGISSAMTSPQMMKAILTAFREIRYTDLLHDEVPITAYGPWSWCPQSIFSFGRLYHSPDISSGTCTLYPTGVVSGSFWAYEVLENDILIPCGSHPAIRARVSAAFVEREKCVLLTTRQLLEDQLFILAQPVFVNHSTVCARWIACVQLHSPLDPIPYKKSDDKDAVTGTRRELTHLGFWEIGNDTTRSGEPLLPLTVDCVLWDMKLSGVRVAGRHSTGRQILSIGLNGRPAAALQPRGWAPQTIYFHDPDDASNRQPSHNTLRPVRNLHPVAMAAWDIDTLENCIRKSYLDALSKITTVTIVTQDIVSIVWSFPDSPNLFPDACKSPRHTTCLSVGNYTRTAYIQDCGVVAGEHVKVIRLQHAKSSIHLYGVTSVRGAKIDYKEGMGAIDGNPLCHRSIPISPIQRSCC
ncbi:hypothetical protein GGR57DRAFT_510491 [Xylariaceae sp. FL1272]|nr:hypothetical protein GGR57DRAFT_510491 [Xylariaceae sp. FL1272]